MQSTYPVAEQHYLLDAQRATFEATAPVVLSPAMQMSVVAAHRGLRWYEGTVDPAVVARRRAANKRARRARRVHRR